MQHWHEPQPLGEAQRTGYPIVSQQQAPNMHAPSSHEAARQAAIRRQIQLEQARRDEWGQWLAKNSHFVALSTLALVGVGAMAGFYVGTWYGKDRFVKQIGERSLKRQELGENPEDDDDGEDEDFDSWEQEG